MEIIWVGASTKQTLTFFDRLRRTITPFQQYQSGKSRTSLSDFFQTTRIRLPTSIMKQQKQSSLRSETLISSAQWRNSPHLVIACQLPRIELPSSVPHFESNISPYEPYSYLIPYHKQDYHGGELLPSQKDRHSVLYWRLLEISGTFYDTIAHAEPKIDPGQYRTPDDFWTALKQLKSTIPGKGRFVGQFNHLG